MGIRILTADELMLVAGGWGSTVDTGSQTVIGGGSGGGGGYNPGGNGGDGQGGGGNSGGDTSQDDADNFDIEGGCPVEAAAARDALKTLAGASMTARDLIAKAHAAGVDLNLIEVNASGFGARDSFENNDINWDPFMYLTGTNTDGSSYSISPIMLLAHELVHAGNAGNPAYQGPGSESLVMEIVNQIAREINLVAHTNFNTNRDNHVGRYQQTDSISSTAYSVVKPGC